MSKRKMSLQDACDIVPDDLPDGAYWAMAHEIAGAEYGEAWGELDGAPQEIKKRPSGRCPYCGKKCADQLSLKQHQRMSQTCKQHRQRMEAQ